MEQQYTDKDAAEAVRILYTAARIAPLTANDHDALRQHAERLLTFLQQKAQPVDAQPGGDNAKPE